MGWGVGAGKGGGEGGGKGTGDRTLFEGARKTQYIIKQDFFPVRVFSTSTNLSI